MKIKTKKKMRLDELIKYVMDNNLTNKSYIEDKGHAMPCVRVSPEGYIHLHGNITKGAAFTVEVCEELTEETEIHGATFVYYDELKREIKPFRYADVTSPTLKHIIQPRSGTVALAVFRGKQLIWTKEHGIPADGILEVDVE